MMSCKGEAMAKAGNYYYDQLNKEQQRAYYAMKEGLLNLQDSFAVPMLSQKELSDIYFLIRMDCPAIFYSVTFSYKYYANSTAVEMIPQYLFSKDKIKEHRQAMEARVKKLARQAAVLDEKGKELFIHDFIVENIKYDKLKKAYSHEIIGALGNGVAVCEGIAKAVFYYKEKKISWTTMDEVQNQTKQAVKKGKVLLFHWRGGYLTREILAQLFEIFDKEAKAKDKRACISVNWPQAVLRVRFENGAGEEQIEMEEANEGEKD